MKKLNLFFAVLVCSLVFSMGAKAQAPTDYFIGKWDCLTTGLPQGSSKTTIVLERTDSKMTGYVLDDKGKKTVFSKVDEKPNNVTLYFTHNAYNVYIYMEKVDDNNIAGSTMDMFDMTGKRVLETKTDDTK